ncbi:LacI family DNA-binding transcriptional regulator, partial [Streptomyces rimosus]
MTAHEQPTSARPRTAAGPRVTSRDVARAAGVSQAAVSLVLGDKWRGRVSPHKAESVRAAARDLGYRPNLAARSLRMGRTRTALLVVPALTTEYFARVYTGAARVAADHDFGVVLYP